MTHTESLVSYVKKKLPPGIIYILFLFTATRIFLTAIGIYARAFLPDLRGAGFANYSSNIFLNIWGVWDTGWYLNIANGWYSAIPVAENQANYAFFPLYPTLIKILGWITQDNFIAGIIISNVFLIVASVLLYKLVKMDSDENTAKNSVKYLFLFPTAFVFSGVFPESLFIALAIACFYFAKKEEWLYASISGFLLALTKQLGVLIILPLLYEYLAKKDFKPEKIKKDIVYLLFIPLGLFIFCFYNYILTGDFLAFVHIQTTAWNNNLSRSPFTLVASIFGNEPIYSMFNGLFAIFFIILLLKFYKKIGFSYWLFGMYYLFSSLYFGFLTSISRYILMIFPFYILFAKLLKDKPYLEKAASILFIILQAILMAYWTNGYYFTI